MNSRRRSDTYSVLRLSPFGRSREASPWVVRDTYHGEDMRRKKTLIAITLLVALGGAVLLANREQDRRRDRQRQQAGRQTQPVHQQAHQRAVKQHQRFVERNRRR